jgi:hypothetical protein
VAPLCPCLLPEDNPVKKGQYSGAEGEQYLASGLNFVGRMKLSSLQVLLDLMRLIQVS